MRRLRLRSMMEKHTISALPLPSPSQLLIHRLTPDTHTPSVSAFRTTILPKTPSLQRRARLLEPQSHYSLLTPLPIPFPYDIEAPVPPAGAAPIADKASYIESWLAAREATHERPLPADAPPRPLRIYDPTPGIRDQPRILIGLSETGLRDCLPHLDVGDAFALLGTPSLAGPFADEDTGDPVPGGVKARQELVDVLSGHSVLMTPPGEDDDTAFAPWALRYSGHQFGSWAGQLGDGRAISILTTPHPTQPLTYELQLKGAGRTPFSRTADGLAVVRSSIREFLCAEAMHALRIPTTRSLALVSLPDLPVERERTEPACVVTRVAPSFLRIGSFEALNGPANMFFFGGGQQKPDYEALRVLGEWVARDVLKLELESGAAWGKELVLEVARRNARMVAGWQAYGFMHGVINTDNVSIMGLTIDYGPYAFMDVFDPLHICNHSDDGGRYAYKYQPNMIIYALRSLLSALAPLIGAESALGRAVAPSWAATADKEQLEAWRVAGMSLKDELERVAQDETAREYARLMRARLGLRTPSVKDEGHLFRPLLGMMEAHRLDFHGTFRTLCAFRPSWLDPTDSTPNANADSAPALQAFIAALLEGTPEPEKLDHARAAGEWIEWLGVYAARIRGEDGDGESWGKEGDEERETAMRAVNPRFVLRQWLLEEVIAKVERDAESGRRVLAKVLHMACNPFEPWGAEGDEDAEMDDEEKEERRYCAMGDKKMLGF
ncbi:hypothetical protein H0H81_010625, partial [Sphagnurus paluster]